MWSVSEVKCVATEGKNTLLVFGCCSVRNEVFYQNLGQNTSLTEKRSERREVNSLVLSHLLTNYNIDSSSPLD